MQLIVAYVIALLVFGIVDLIWLSIMGPMLYKPVLGDILLQTVRIPPAIAFYVIFPVGIVYFAALPGLKADSAMTALMNGLLFGAIAYATYDLTNFATLRNWNLQITALDIVYGAFACGVAAAIATIATRYAMTMFASH